MVTRSAQSLLVYFRLNIVTWPHHSTPHWLSWIEHSSNASPASWVNPLSGKVHAVPTCAMATQAETANIISWPAQPCCWYSCGMQKWGWSTSPCSWQIPRTLHLWICIYQQVVRSVAGVEAASRALCTADVLAGASGVLIYGSAAGEEGDSGCWHCVDSGGPGAGGDHGAEPWCWHLQASATLGQTLHIYYLP